MLLLKVVAAGTVNMDILPSPFRPDQLQTSDMGVFTAEVENNERASFSNWPVKEKEADNA